jgi:hypothetical protein
VIESEVVDLLKEYGVQLHPGIQGVICHQMQAVDRLDLKEALDVIFSNAARTHKPTSNEIIAATRSVIAARKSRIRDIPDSELAPPELARASAECVRKMITAKTSRERAKLLCDWTDWLRQHGHLSPHTQELADAQVQAMLALDAVQ